jgi:hypothetical protein
MNANMLKTAAGGLVMLAAASTFALSQTADKNEQALSVPGTFSAQEQAVLDVEQALLQGRVTKDTSAAKEYFAEEGMYMHSSGFAQNKDEVLKMVAENPWGHWTKSEQEIHLYGNLAVTHSLLAVQLIDKRTETVRTTGAYVKQSGKWRQVSWQSSIGKYENTPDSSGK